jgi:hypothetical protein
MRLPCSTIPPKDRRFGVEDLIEASGMIDNVERLGIVMTFVSKFLGSTMLIAGFSL